METLHTFLSKLQRLDHLMSLIKSYHPLMAILDGSRVLVNARGGMEQWWKAKSFVAAW